MTDVLNARRCYIIVCVCLLVVAAALRFDGLSEYALLYDEALAAINSKGAFVEVIDRTRDRNSSPILYPLALWAVQKVWSAEFSVRFMPALGSALTVLALLFWMPRLGVARGAAFGAALLTALSVAAIEHAQDGREYSLDALVAVLVIAGTLRYLRDGRSGLLCAGLFVGPLLQYGLALFGVAALCAAALAAPAASAQTGANAGVRRANGVAILGWLRGRIGLLLPIACFGAACALSWWVTLRYQWTDGGWGGGGAYLTGYYYQGGFDAAAIAMFVVGRTWDLLIYHMPSEIATVALLAFGALGLAWWLRRRRLDAVALLALFAVGVSLCAALLRLYPLGDIRQCLYLGPIVFLAAGGAFHSLAEDAARVARRAWVEPALALAAAGMIALAGAAAVRQYDLRQYSLYYSVNNIRQVLAAIDEREREGDAVYVYRWAVPSLEFYKGEKPDNYFYESVHCPTALWTERVDCVPEALAEMFGELSEARRIWLIHNVKVSVPKEIAAYSQEVSVEEIAVEKIAPVGWNTLHLITGFGGVASDIRKGWLAMYEAVASEAPSVVSDYNLYLRDDALYYAKRPCAAADTDARFFLHIYSGDAAGMRAAGGVLENLDFDFADYGFRAGDKCIIRRGLPEYPDGRIHTGQFVYPDGTVVWEAELPFNR